MYKLQKILSVTVVIVSTIMFFSCKNDFSYEEHNGKVITLSAYKEKMISRAVSESNFETNTRFRIWVNNRNSDSPLFEEAARGIDGIERLREDGVHYIDVDPYNDRLVGEIDFYGFTAAVSEPVPLPKEGSNYTYDIQLNSDNDYTDYRRGILKFDDRKDVSSNIIRIPFKHIMSQVKIYVMREEGVTSELELSSLEFIGKNDGTVVDNQDNSITTAATYNVYDNTFLNPTKGIRKIDKNCDIPIVGTSSEAYKKAAEVGTFLFFPEEQIADKYYMRVSFNDPDNFYKNGSDASIVIPILDNRVQAEQALHFEQNTSYSLYITFLSNTARIVTLVPEVYEWIDGETENKDEDGYYQEQDLGQPVTFNGVMWSDRNLGASSAHPTRSMDDWNKSVGYFYQYGRNIPYFPNNLKEDGTVDLKTPLGTALAMDDSFKEGDKTNKSGGLIYPVINYESWSTTAQDERYSIKPLDNKNANGKYFIRKLGYGQNEQNHYWGFVYNNYNLDHINNEGWDKGYNSPCPPGWRLPTTDDFKGIIPGSGYSGNITFRKYTGIGDNGSWAPGNSSQEPDFLSVFSKEKIIDYKGFDGGPVGVNEQVYQGYFPCIFREEKNDPENGTKSQYVLSMKDNDWNKVKQTSGDIRNDGNYVYNWGVIYGIKKQGTASAYRVKWEVRLQSESEPFSDEKNNLVYSAPFRGVLVISRFQATKSDAFTPDNNGSYEHIIDDFDWEHPVEQLLLPIGGIVDNWSQGHLANIGTEAWYAISDRTGITDNYHKKIFWFKFCGTNTASQTAVISDKSLMVAAVQVRCVRDFNYKK